jgi:hypothetical protein
LLWNQLTSLAHHLDQEAPIGQATDIIMARKGQVHQEGLGRTSLWRGQLIFQGPHRLGHPVPSVRQVVSTTAPQQSSSQASYGSNRSAYSTGSGKSAYSGKSSTGSLDPARRVLQSHTIYSRSSKRNEIKKLPSQFRRDFTPNSWKFLDSTYFIRHKSSDRFKNVMKDKLCLRCAGTHFGNECKTYRTPCNYPCRLCTHLFHPVAECIYFKMDGTPKMAAKN